MTRAISNYLQRTSFVLSLLALLGVLALLWFGKIPGASADFLVPAIVSIYVGGEAARKVTTITSAARDPNASLENIVKLVQGTEQRPAPEEPPT